MGRGKGTSVLTPAPGHWPGQVKELYKGQKVMLELHLENKALNMQISPSSRMPSALPRKSVCPRGIEVLHATQGELRCRKC